MAGSLAWKGMLEKSQKYDKKMVRKCMAGPNALYLTEELTDSMNLEPDMLVLDLGCGRALSSVFLAKEYGSDVYAVDLNVRASETYQMLKDVGLSHKVFPIQAGAEALPIMPGMIDALICVNAYHNFGMQPEFFQKHLKHILKPGAQVGLVLPATDQSFVAEEDRQENEQPVFWTAANWRRWFEKDLDICECSQLNSTVRAWQEWIAVNGAVEQGEENLVKLNPRLALVKITGTVKY